MSHSPACVEQRQLASMSNWTSNVSELWSVTAKAAFKQDVMKMSAVSQQEL